MKGSRYSTVLSHLVSIPPPDSGLARMKVAFVRSPRHLIRSDLVVEMIERIDEALVVLARRQGLGGSERDRIVTVRISLPKTWSRCDLAGGVILRRQVRRYRAR